MKESDEPVKPLRGSPIRSSWRQGAIWDVAHFVCGGWQGDRFLRAPGDAGQFMPELQSIKALANELCSRLSCRTIRFSELVGKFQELLGDRFRFSEAVCLVLCQDIPDRHEEFPRDRDNGFVASQAWLQASQFCLPVWMGVGCHLGCLDEDPPQIASSCLGDASCADGHATVMDSCTQTGIAHQVFRFRKTLDIANRSPDGHSRHDAKARALQLARD